MELKNERVSLIDLTRVIKTTEFSGKVISLIYQLQIRTINTIFTILGLGWTTLSTLMLEKARFTYWDKGVPSSL